MVLLKGIEERGGATLNHGWNIITNRYVAVVMKPQPFHWENNQRNASCDTI